MADGSLDTEDIRVEERGKERVFTFRHYAFTELPVHLVCFDDERITLKAKDSDLGAIIPVTSDRIPDLCAYCASNHLAA